MRNRRVLFVVMVALLLASLAGTSLAAVPPTLVAGNPSCTDLGFAHGYKVNAGGAEDNPWGTWNVGPGTITVYGPNEVPGGLPLNWSSTFGIDAVIVKGGPNANVYYYNPESMGDTELYTPANASGGYAGLSHVEFCYDYEVTVTKTANATYTRTYSWTITKGPDGDYKGFTGDSFVHGYTVSVDQTVVDSNFAVSGTITIVNPDPKFTANIASVTDSVDGIPATVVCPGTGSLAPGATLECTYSAGLPDASTRTNTATVTTAPGDKVGGGQGTAQVVFGNPTVVGYPTINVTDTNEMSWNASGDASWSYDKTFTCDGDEGENPNTATIVETKQSASAKVTVACYALNVTKDAATSFTRNWDWTIVKTGDQTELILSVGQQFLVNYDVTVSATSTDSAWAVNGTITVNNPAPIAATLNSVNDVVSPAIAATVNCGVGFPYVLAAGGTLDCTYSTPLLDASDRTNTATATIQNYKYEAGLGVATGTTNFSHTIPVSFAGAAMSEVDECINVSDTYAGDLGTVCQGESPKKFSYERLVGNYTTCGMYTVDNTASFVTNDTSATDDDSHTVNVNVPCDVGCSLTPGYWKTHSDNGPAPYDDTWALIGEDTAFFMSGTTWYGALWTPPAGNAYWILAHAYIAAVLNDLNGADTSAITTELAEAKTLFEVLAVRRKQKLLRISRKLVPKSRLTHISLIVCSVNSSHAANLTSLKPPSCRW
jgi:hypothetical protein